MSIRRFRGRPAVVAFMVLCAAVAPALVVAAGPTTAPALPADHPATLAISALNAGDANGALKIATDWEAGLRKERAKPTDAALLNALQLQGIARMKLGQWKPASAAFQRTYSLVTSNRSVLINTSITDLNEGSMIPRAIKNLEAYAKAHPTDEQVIDLWGVAIDRLAASGKSGKLDALEAAYKRVDKQLEASRPGERRWGTDWVSEPRFAEIEATRAKNRRTYDYYASELERANNSLRQAKQRVAQLSGPLMGSYQARHEYYGDNCVACVQERRTRELSYAQSELTSAEARVGEAQRNFDRANDAMPRPTWTADLTPVDAELVP